MKTLNEIKTHFKQLITAINAEMSAITENQAILMQLEDSVYDEKTHHISSKYLTYLQHIMSHTQIVKVMRAYAESLSSLKVEIDKKIVFVRKHGAQFLNGEKLATALIEIAIACESISGDLYSLGGELDEKMLYLTRLYLENNVVHSAFHEMAESHQEVFNFCIPWMKYHHNEEKEPLMAAFRTLASTSLVSPTIAV